MSIGSKSIGGKFSKYDSYFGSIMKDINRNELERLKEAGRYAAKVMKANVNRKSKSKPGGFPGRRTGSTFRKIGYQVLEKDHSARVGSKDFRAHLLEFGHGDGKERNKRPFVFRSLREAEPEIIRIMSSRYF